MKICKLEDIPKLGARRYVHGNGETIAVFRTAADTVFALATGTWDGQPNITVIGGLAAEALSEAIVRAATQAASSGGLASARETGTVPARYRSP